jgi:hypothetical protein
MFHHYFTDWRLRLQWDDNMKVATRWAWGVAILAAVMLAGCKAAPAPSAGFADPKELTPDPKIPFNKFWRDSDVNWKSYKQIYVAEVNTSYMLKISNWQEGERKGHFKQDVTDLAVYTQEAIIKAFRDDPNHRFKVADSPTHDRHALVFEMALVEVVPSKIVLNILDYAPFYVGDAITAVRFMMSDESTVAFELRVRDAATGKIILLAADREAQRFAPVDVRQLSWYSNVKEIIDEWSKEFVEVIDKKPDEKIKAHATFRLLPW